MISVVCFDLGGVLVRLSSSWQDASQRAGVPAHPDAVLETEEVRSARWQIVQAYQAGSLSCEQYYAGLAQVMRVYSAAEIERIHAAWIIEHYPGVVDLIDRLNRLPSIVTACLSNTNHAHWQVMTQAGGEYPGVGRLEKRMASHELGLNKPDPRIYERAAELLGQPARAILFFDDLEENVAAAKLCGWNVERIDPQADTARQMHDHLARYGVHLPA